MREMTMPGVMNRRGGRAANPHLEEVVTRYYPTMSAGEIAAAFDLSREAVSSCAYRKGIRHTEPTLARLKEKKRAQLNQARKKINHQRHGRKLHRLWQREYERSWESYPQLTRLRLAQTTRRAWWAKYHLRHRHGYECHPTEPYTMVITPTTRRTKMEYLYVKRYGITFVER